MIILKLGFKSRREYIFLLYVNFGRMSNIIWSIPTFFEVVFCHESVDLHEDIAKIYPRRGFSKHRTVGKWSPKGQKISFLMYFGSLNPKK